MKSKNMCYLKDKNDEDEKAKATKEWVIKRKIKFQDYKNCLEASQVENKINDLEKMKLIEIVWKIKNNL